MAIEDSPHEYEPGESSKPMHTDPMCAACGQPEAAPVHSQRERVLDGLKRHWTTRTTPEGRTRFLDPVAGLWLDEDAAIINAIARDHARRDLVNGMDAALNNEGL